MCQAVVITNYIIIFYKKKIMIFILYCIIHVLTRHSKTENKNKDLRLNKNLTIIHLF